MVRAVGLRGAYCLSALLLVVVALSPPAAWAQNATWLLNPGSNAYGTATNWSPNVLPLGTATFGVSNRTTIDISGGSNIGSLVFNAGASAYTFSNANFSLSGTGIVNNSSQTQTININATGVLALNNSATLGNATIVSANSIVFNDSTSAGRAIITNNGGNIQFEDNTTAANATITNNAGGTLCFCNNATAGSATIVNTGTGATLNFFADSTAGSARITNAADTAIAEATSLYLRYDGEVGTGVDNHVFSAGLRMSW